MWSDTFVLTERIKWPLLAWTGGLAIGVTALAQLDVERAMILPESILGIVAQTFIVVAALRVGATADVHAATRPNFARVFGISLLSVSAILVGALFVVIPGILLLIRWWVAIPVALDRDIGVIDALRESWRITAPHWASITGLFLGLSAMLVVPMIGIYLLGGFEDGDVSPALTFATNLTTYIVTNLGTVSTVTVYRAISEDVSDLRAVFE